LVVLVVLGLMVVSTTVESWPALREAGSGFLTLDRWAPNLNSFGALSMVQGTFTVSVIAVVLAVPVSIGIALFTTEVAPHGLRGPLTVLVDLLAAVPSVIYGLWGILFVAPSMSSAYGGISSAVGRWPLLGRLFGGGGGSGRSFMTAGLIVALMIVPIITSVAREVLATVPRRDKEAALALGATRWEMIRGAVLPHSFGGLVGATM